MDSQLANVVDGGGHNVSQLKNDDVVILVYACCYVVADADYIYDPIDFVVVLFSRNHH